MNITRRRFVFGSAGLIALAGGGYGAIKLSRPSLLQSPGQSRARRITADNLAPRETDVAIIGAGIVGVMAAMALVQKGYKVAIFEKGVVAGEQSSRAFGWISSLGDSLPRLHLAHPTKAIWASLQQQLGIDATYRVNGLLYECADDAAVSRWEKWAQDNKELGGQDVRILKGKALEERLQHGNSRPWYAGVIQPTDGSVEPPQAVPLIAEALRSQGVTIIENCAVRGIETSGGAVSSIVTEMGETRCQAVVLAGGAWSRLFLQNNGIDLPLLRVYSYQSRIPGFEGGPEGSGLGSGTVWRKDISGGYSLGTPVNTAPILPDNFRFFNQFSGTVSANWSNFKLDLSRDFLSELVEEKSWSNGDVTPFEKHRILAPLPDHERSAAGLDKFRQAFPKASSVQIIEEWGGVIDMTPDTAPIIQKIDTIPGLMVVAGMSGHGLSMGPAAGKLAAELLANETTTVADPQMYRASRFSA